ncbi:MAG: HD domain-containing protein [Candidatus Zixiibacteriota bacterium]
MREILREGCIFEVGGFVRDSLLRRKVAFKDRDYLVTGIPYDRLQAILKRFGRVDLVGRSFGVIKFTPYSRTDDSDIEGTCDISLPRAEKSTGPAHTDFEVDFNPDIPVEDDLLRRDFSINAMARSLADGTLIDPYGGRDDLNDRIIRMVSDNSFKEDPLRMLRAIQFAARFEFTIEPKTYQCLVDNVDLITTVSPERIAEELNKMLVRAEKPSIGLRLMQETGLLHHIIPELEDSVGCEQPGGYHKYDVFEHTLRIVDACPPRLHLRLAGIFHDITKPIHKRINDTGATFYGHESSGAKVAQKVLKRLRYSNDIIHDVMLLVERHMFTTEVGPKGLRRFIRRIGQRLIPDLLDLRRADVIAQGMGGTTEDVDEMEQAIKDEIERKPPFGRSDLKVNGKDIMTLFGLKESPRVGEVIEFLMEKVLDNPDDNERDTLIRYAGDYLNGKIVS